MRLCTKCNRMLKSSDTYCPYCAGEKVDESTASAVDQPVDVPATDEKIPVTGFDETAENSDQPASTDAHGMTLEIPLQDIVEPEKDPAQTEEEPVAVVAAVPKKSNLLDEGLEPQGMTMEIPLDDNSMPFEGVEEEESETDLVDDEVDSDLGFIERELAIIEEDDDDEESSGTLGKLGVTLIVILVLAVIFFGYLIIQKLSGGPGNNGLSSEAVASLLKGGWISDEFTYSDEDETRVFVEYLVFHEDGTFTLQNLVPNRSIPDGYLTGDWEVFESLTGRYEIDLDRNMLWLYYEDDTGQELFMAREITEISEKTLVLREYYNPEFTDFFDVRFTRAS